MLHHFRAIAFILTIASLSGCSYLKDPKLPKLPAFPSLPGVYKFPIQQGNIVTQDMVDQLRPGMTRSQVRFVMGTPLIADTFNQSRWDYWYSVRLPNGKELREQIAVHFTDDALSGITGDYLPSSANQAVSADMAAVEDLPTSDSASKPMAEDTPAEAPVAVPVPEESDIGAEDQSRTLDQDF